MVIMLLMLTYYSQIMLKNFLVHRQNISICTYTPARYSDMHCSKLFANFIATFRWCCDHLHQARKDCEQFWAGNVRISSWCITTTATMTLKSYIYSFQWFLHKMSNIFDISRECFSCHHDLIKICFSCHLVSYLDPGGRLGMRLVFIMTWSKIALVVI